jgi:hypothetical protein
VHIRLLVLAAGRALAISGNHAGADAEVDAQCGDERMIGRGRGSGGACRPEASDADAGESAPVRCQDSDRPSRMTGFAGETEFWHPTTLSAEPPWQISVPGFATGGAAAPPAAIKASAAIVRGATGRTARATAYGFAELPVLAPCPPYSDCNVADKRAYTRRDARENATRYPAAAPRVSRLVRGGVGED